MENNLACNLLHVLTIALGHIPGSYYTPLSREVSIQRFNQIARTQIWLFQKLIRETQLCCTEILSFIEAAVLQTKNTASGMLS